MKAYRLNEYDWYAGNDAEEAIAAAMAETGLARDEIIDDLHFGEAGPNTPVRREDDEPPTTIGAIVASMAKPGYVCGIE